MSNAEISDQVKQALKHTSLSGGGEASELSGGQQQRIALARAIVSSAKVLLLDEPLSNLDPKLREIMRFEIKDLQKKLGLTIVYVTHDQAEAMALSDRMLVMDMGVVQQVDTPTNMYNNPANRFVFSPTIELRAGGIARRAGLAGGFSGSNLECEIHGLGRRQGCACHSSE